MEKAEVQPQQTPRTALNSKYQDSSGDDANVVVNDLTTLQRRNEGPPTDPTTP
jgi:hypothetical protein